MARRTKRLRSAFARSLAPPMAATGCFWGGSREDVNRRCLAEKFVNQRSRSGRYFGNNHESLPKGAIGIDGQRSTYRSGAKARNPAIRSSRQQSRDTGVILVVGG